MHVILEVWYKKKKRGMFAFWIFLKKKKKKQLEKMQKYVVLV